MTSSEESATWLKAMALPTCAARAATSSLFTTSTHAAASACCTRPAQPGAPSSALHSFVRRLHSTARRAGVPCEGCGRRAAGCGLRAAGGHRRPPAPRRCSASAQSPLPHCRPTTAARSARRAARAAPWRPRSRPRSRPRRRTPGGRGPASARCFGSAQTTRAQPAGRGVSD